MLWRIRAFIGTAAVALLLPSVAQAEPTALPTVDRTLSADSTTSDSCLTADGAGTDRTTYVAPMSGYLNARLAAPDSSDWDLVLRDAESGLNIAASQAFGSHEVAQIWVKSGQRVIAQACRESGSARSASLGFTLVDATPPTPAGTVSLMRVQGSSRQLDALDRFGLDVTENSHANGTDVLVAGQKQLDALKASGLPYETRIPDMSAYAAHSRAADLAVTASSPLPSGRTTYRTLDDVQSELKQFGTDHPGLVRPVNLGKSFQGRDIQGLEIANNVNGNDGRPVFFLVAMHHAREWPSVEAAMEYAHLLVQGQNDPRIANLLKNERTVIVPVVNPDGFNSSRSAADPGDTIRDLNGGKEPQAGPYPPSTLESIAPPGGVAAYRRKNCDGEFSDEPSVPCELQYGVDPNRNYGNLWGGNGASPDPSSQAYHGPGPRSEPEVRAIWDYSRTHQVTTLISLHNVAALVLRPPGLHDSGKAPDEARLKAIGDAMANATGYTSEYGFQLYDTAGTTEDDTYAAEGGYGYTIEIGPENGAFHMPYQTGFIDEWTGDNPKAQNRGGLKEALLLAGEAAASTPDHAVLRGSAPVGATLRLHKDFKTTTSEYCPMAPDPVVNVSTPLDDPLACPGGKHAPIQLDDTLDSTTTVPPSGQFEWHVNQSTRPFVGGGAVSEKLSDTSSRTDTFTGGQGTAPGDSEDRPFTVTADDHADAVKIDVEWGGSPEDYDIEVYKGTPDDPNAKLVGSSGSSPGIPEHVVLEHPETGDYFLRVINFAAGVSQWTATIGRYESTQTVTTGHKEAYTMTCEQGGNVIATHEVIIDRGQAIDMNPCSTDTGAGAPPEGGGGSGGTGGESGGTAGSGEGATPTVDGKPVANSPASAGSVTPLGVTAQSPVARPQPKRAKRLSCRAKAKKIKNRSKRRRALRRCQKKHRPKTRPRAH
jgi:Zinc carboxypeptidase